MKKCCYCKSEFQPKKNDKRIKFCCSQCRAAWFRENNAHVNRDYQSKYYNKNKKRISDRDRKKRIAIREQRECRCCGKPCLDFKFKYHCSTECVIETQKKYDREWKKNRLKQFAEFKLLRGCDKCGYKKSAYALDFHHPDKNKEKQVSSLKNCTWERMLSEAAKCELLCKNCHAEEHEKQGGYYVKYKRV
jgi:hypothetical protein